MIVKKILMFPVNLLVWMSHNPAETMLLSVLAFSMLPLFHHVGSPSLLGGFITFMACIYEKYVFKYEKPTKLYHILLLIVLIMAVIAMFAIGNKEYKSIWTPVDNLLATYLGSFWGMMMAHLIISLNDGQQAEKQKQKEINRIIEEQQNQQNIIRQKEKEGFIAIKRNGKLIGYIEKQKYDLFVDENIKIEPLTRIEDTDK